MRGKGYGLSAALLIALLGCASKKPVVNLVPHAPQGEEKKFWRDCQEVTAANSAPEQKTFQCVDVNGGLYLVRFTKLGNQ